jgi:hypothetical protein
MPIAPHIAVMTVPITLTVVGSISVTSFPPDKTQNAFARLPDWLSCAPSWLAITAITFWIGCRNFDHWLIDYRFIDNWIRNEIKSTLAGHWYQKSRQNRDGNELHHQISFRALTFRTAIDSNGIAFSPQIIP